MNWKRIVPINKCGWTLSNNLSLQLFNLYSNKDSRVAEWSMAKITSSVVGSEQYIKID